MIDIKGNLEIISSVQRQYENFREFNDPEIIIGKINVLTSIQILQNQIELSKQLQRIEEKLPHKLSGSTGPG